MTYGLLDANQQRFNEADDLYGYANWALSGAPDMIKGTFANDRPLSFDHWMNSFGTAGLAFGGYYSSKNLLSNNSITYGTTTFPENQIVLYDPDFAASQILNQPSNITPFGRIITAHAADRMVNPPIGRISTTVTELDYFLNTATSIRKITQHPLGDTITLRNTNSHIFEVVVDAQSGNKVITVITPKK